MTDTSQLHEEPVDDRYLSSGDEAGTAPGDRRFRPDVEGLRAVAVLLVVLYHAEFPGITGGFVGVDVFFVISGFVITGLLLRERVSAERTSLLRFYARRCRRILPAATLVILSAVVLSYLFLGVVSGANTAGDGRWAAVFLANFHFDAVGTDYFLSLRPPSPLQNFWSLSVEEQFYIVYPSLFLVLARMKGRISLRGRLTIVLVPVIVLSYILSIVQTSHSPASAYFSPLTRAWELALGALIAVGVPVIKRLPGQVCMALTWSGMAVILISAFTFSAATPYPGSLVAIPVVGTGLVIAGGVGVPRWGVEAILKLGPAQWLGRLSYSLYLWHWPILVIAAQEAGKTQLPVWENAIPVLVAVVLSITTYRLVEDPIRHSKLTARHSVIFGGILVGSTVLILTLVLATRASGASLDPVVPAPNAHAERQEVIAAARIHKLPKGLSPPLGGPAVEWDDGVERSDCIATLSESTERICTLGDPRSKNLMVVYGDSHAAMWLPAFQWIASTAHWKLVVLSKPYCPADDLTIADPPGLGGSNAPDRVCDEWHRWATSWINTHRPQLLVITQESIYKVPVAGSSSSRWAYVSDWRRGLLRLFASLTDKQTRTVILGNIPVLAQPGPQCLSAHESDVQACSTPVASAVQFSNAVEEATASRLGIGYVDSIPWFCSSVCTAVVGRYNIFLDGIHINASWATYLEVVLGQSLGLIGRA